MDREVFHNSSCQILYLGFPGPSCLGGETKADAVAGYGKVYI